MHPGTILLGVVMGAHGLKGEIKVRTFTDTPDALSAYGPIMAGDGRQFEVASLRTTKANEAIVRIKGILNRSSAESLRGEKFFVPRAALPEPEENEFYHADLIGLHAEDEDGRARGIVRGIHNFGAGDMVEIEAPDGTTGLVAFTKGSVPVVDIAGKRIVIAAPGDVAADSTTGRSAPGDVAANSTTGRSAPGKTQ